MTNMNDGSQNISLDKPVSYSTIPIDKNLQSINKEKLFETLSKFWNTFNKYLVCIMIATAIGISIGVKVAQKFYSEKMDDATLAGSMVFKGKAFNIIPKN